MLLIFGSVQRWLDKFNGVLLPFYLGGLLLAVVLATREYGYSDAWLAFGPAGGPVAGGWWDAYVYYMGVWILMMFTFDLSLIHIFSVYCVNVGIQVRRGGKSRS